MEDFIGPVRTQEKAMKIQNNVDQPSHTNPGDTTLKILVLKTYMFSSFCRQQLILNFRDRS